MTSPGALHLVPNTLDFGTSGTLPELQDVMPLGVIRLAAGLDHWIAENAKTTRAFLKRVDAVVPLVRPLQTIAIAELPRPRKGGGTPMDAGAGGPPRREDESALLEPALQGHAMGLISEAGLPAVADPGARVVEAAHALGVRVVSWPGASSLLLALAASGLNGQSFAFVGYLPADAGGRAARIRALETVSRQQAQTQLMIETPYRNAALLAALIEHLQPTTRLAVSCGLTLQSGSTRSDSVAGWRSRETSLPANIPAVFSLLAVGRERTVG